MPTEQFVIVIRETGARRTAASINRVGFNARRATSGILLFTRAAALIGSAAVTGGIIGLADEFTNLRNRLRVVFDSEQEVNAALGELRDIANETRAPIDGVVRLFSRLKLVQEGLGATTQEIATVTRAVGQALQISGASAQEARAGLTQFSQALAQGQVQGDELRGILEGIIILGPEVSRALDIDFAELQRLRKEGGIPSQEFFRALLIAAERLDEKFKRTQPTVASLFTTLRNELVLAVGEFDKIVGQSDFLREKLLGLRGGTRDFVLRGLAFMVDAFGSLLEVGADLDTFFIELGVNLGDTANGLELFGSGILAIFKSIQTGISAILNVFLRGKRLLLSGGQEIAEFLNIPIDITTPEELARLDQQIEKSTRKLVENAFELEGAIADFGQNVIDLFNTEGAEDRVEKLEGLGERAKALAAELRATIAAGRDAPDFDDLFGGEEGGAGTLGGGPSKEQLKALEEIEERTRRIKQENIAAGEPLNAQVESIQQRIKELRELAEKSGEITAADTAILGLENQIEAVERKRASLQNDIDTTLARISQKVEQIARFSPELAKDIEAAAMRALDLGEGLEDTSQRLEKVSDDAEDAFRDVQQQAEQLGRTIGQALSGAISTVLRSALSGEAVNFAEILADTSAQLLENSLNEVLKGVGSQLQKLLASQSGGGAEGGATAGRIVSGIGAALGLGLGLLSSALRETEVTETAGQVQSAVDSVERVRGIVAGPTQIPILQVGESIEEAFEEPTRFLASIDDNIMRLLVAFRAAGGTIIDPLAAEEDTSVTLA